MYNYSSSKISSSAEFGHNDDWSSIQNASAYVQHPMQYSRRLPIHHVSLNFTTDLPGLLQSSASAEGGCSFRESHSAETKSNRALGQKTIRFGDRSLMDISESVGIANQLESNGCVRNATEVLSPPITPAQGSFRRHKEALGNAHFVDSKYPRFGANDVGRAVSWTKDETSSSSSRSPTGGASVLSSSAAANHAMGDECQANGCCGHPGSRHSFGHFQHRPQLQQKQHSFHEYLADNGSRQITDSNLESDRYLNGGKCY